MKQATRGLHKWGYVFCTQSGKQGSQEYHLSHKADTQVQTCSWIFLIGSTEGEKTSMHYSKCTPAPPQYYSLSQPQALSSPFLFSIFFTMTGLLQSVTQSDAEHT